MIEKRQTCKYCGAPMESITAKKQFCKPIHRVYWNREKARGTLEEISADGFSDPKLIEGYDKPFNNSSILVPAQKDLTPKKRLELKEVTHILDDNSKVVPIPSELTTELLGEPTIEGKKSFDYETKVKEAQEKVAARKASKLKK